MKIITTHLGKDSFKMFNKIFNLLSRPKKMKEKDAVKIFVDFTTGAITTEQFWEKYNNDETLRNVLIYDKYRTHFYKVKMPDGHVIYTRYNDQKFALNPDNLLEKTDIDKLNDRYRLFTFINRFLIARNIKIDYRNLNKDVKEYLYLSKMLPSWASVEDISFIQNILSSAPENLLRTEKLKWGKEKVKEIFKYDNKKPNRLNDPVWPFKDGMPLVFSHQETVPEGFKHLNGHNKNLYRIERLIFGINQKRSSCKRIPLFCIFLDFFDSRVQDS